MAKKKRRIQRPSDPTLRELESLKRLLMLLLLKAGATQAEIALALQTDQGKVSRVMPARKISRFPNTQSS